MKFTDLNLHENVLTGIKKAEFLECTPVQDQVFEQTLNKKDVFAQSQTGTGKTAAFLISIFQLFTQDENLRKRKALIIVPTRELAVQIEKEAKLLGSGCGFTIGSFYGGVGYQKQLDLIKRGVDVIIGTPGRLIDHNQSGRISFGNLGILVIDEADRLFDMGFLTDIRKMLDKMGPADERISMLFSATLGHKSWLIAADYMNDPIPIKIAPEQKTVTEVTQELYHVSRNEKINLLLGILKKNNPDNVLIFTNTKDACYIVSERLRLNGYQAHPIHGDLKQRKRLRLIEDIKSGRIRYLVATDVASRGLHIDDLDMVINYDVPLDKEDYVHRIGRTARAGSKGKAITLADEELVYNLEAIEKYIEVKIPILWAEDDMYVTDKSDGIRIRRERPGKKHDKYSKERSRKRKTRDRGKRKKHPHPPKENPPKRSKTKLSKEERLEMYRKKYGDNFQIQSEPEKQPKKKKAKKSLIKKIASALIKKD